MPGHRNHFCAKYRWCYRMLHFGWYSLPARAHSTTGNRSRLVYLSVLLSNFHNKRQAISEMLMLLVDVCQPCWFVFYFEPAEPLCQFSVLQILYTSFHPSSASGSLANLLSHTRLTAASCLVSLVSN